MITKTIKYFDLNQIADSGQCFRMMPLQESETGHDKISPSLQQGRAAANMPSSYQVISKTHYLKLVQQGEEISFFCPEEEFPYWETYFDLDTDYGAILSSIDEQDDYLKKAAAYGSGIRILRQDLWEMIITFVISQQKTIPAIRSLVETLSETYGEQFPVPDECGQSGTYFSFPSPEQLNQASLWDLQALKLGYRAKYIKKLCEDACSGALDLNAIRQMSYPEAMTCLQGFYGIGEKVANCVCLFGLHHIDAFPVDTWIRKILLREYAPKSRCAKKIPQTRLCQELVRENFSQYHGCAGVMQQYIFYYERANPNGPQEAGGSPDAGGHLPDTRPRR